MTQPEGTATATEKRYTAKVKIEGGPMVTVPPWRRTFRHLTEDQVDGVRQNVRAITPFGGTCTVEVTEEK